MERDEVSPSLGQAQRLKQLSGEGKLENNIIDLIMREEKPLEAVCRSWMSELKYDPGESFDRAIRSYGNPEESKMSIGMSGPTMG